MSGKEFATGKRVRVTNSERYKWLNIKDKDLGVIQKKSAGGWWVKFDSLRVEGDRIWSIAECAMELCADIKSAKPANPAPKAKWEPAGFRKMLPARPSIAMYESALEDATKTVNKLGAENAKLKNQLRKAKP